VPSTTKSATNNAGKIFCFTIAPPVRGVLTVNAGG
jgi:hypothetical protein